MESTVRLLVIIHRCMGRRNQRSIGDPVTAMSNNTTSMFALATGRPELMILNSHTGSVVQRSPVSSVMTHLLYPSTHLVSASSDGYLRLHDPRHARWQDGESVARAHVGGVQGLESSGNYIYSIGLGTRY